MGGGGAWMGQAYCNMIHNQSRLCITVLLVYGHEFSALIKTVIYMKNVFDALVVKVSTLNLVLVRPLEKERSITHCRLYLPWLMVLNKSLKNVGSEFHFQSSKLIAFVMTWDISILWQREFTAMEILTLPLCPLGYAVSDTCQTVQHADQKNRTNYPMTTDHLALRFSAPDGTRLWREACLDLGWRWRRRQGTGGRCAVWLGGRS